MSHIWDFFYLSSINRFKFLINIFLIYNYILFLSFQTYISRFYVMLSDSKSLVNKILLIYDAMIGIRMIIIVEMILLCMT